MATPVHEIYPTLNQNDLVFASVFSIPSLNYTTPTPIATPNLGSSLYGQSFGGFGSQRHGALSSNPTSQHIKKNIAWSTATRFLRVPRQDEDQDGRVFDGEARPEKTADVVEALQYLLVGEGAVNGWDDVQVTSENLVRLAQG
jgi:anaphase-promoting complex subunit 2